MYRLELRRVLAAPRKDVYSAWTERHVLERWLCHDADKNQVRMRKFDLRPNGSFRVEVTKGTEVYLVFGTYEELAPHERLVFSWAWERMLPNTGELTSEGPTHVTVQLAEQGDATELRLTQDGFPSVERRDADRATWNASFAALEQILASG